MRPNVLNNLLKENKLYEVATIKSRWKQDKIILCDKDRLDCKFMASRYVHFVFEGGIKELAIDEPTPLVVENRPMPPIVAVDTANITVEDAFGA